VKPLTVLQLASNRWWTGSADPVLKLSAGLRARGHRVLLGLIAGDRFEARARTAGLEVVEGLRFQTRFDPLALLRDTRRLRSLLTAERIDLVHAHHSHDHWISALAVFAPGRDGSVPIVRTLHRLRSVKRDLMAQWIYHRTASLFAVSREIEVKCREIGIPAAKVVWIPGAADLKRFAVDVDPRAVRDEFKLDDAPVVVSVSRLAPNRGHDSLLATFRLLRERVPNARLLLVGRGENRSELERVAAERGLGESVIFAGYRDHDLPAVLAAGDCFVLMAAGSDESCRAALEAMAAGRPVVARRVGAMPETVVPGETGLLVDGDRPEETAAALATILSDRARARAMGAAARRRVEQVFAPERSVDVVEGVYRRLV